MKRVHRGYFGPTYTMSRLVRWHVPMLGVVESRVVNFDTIADKRWMKRGLRSARRRVMRCKQVTFRLRVKQKPKALQPR